MSDFNPGKGWREVDLRGEGHLHAIYQLAQYNADNGELVRAWAHEAPAPPLPTVPYTVIRPTYVNDAERNPLVRRADGSWLDLQKSRTLRDPSLIGGYEVLAEPRHDGDELIAFNKAFVAGAEAVLDRIASEPWARQVDLSKWRREFGVAS